MTQARGIFSKVQAWQEATYATRPTTPTTENLYYQNFKLSPSIAQILDPTMSGGYRGELKPIQGNKDITGQVMVTLAPQSCVKWLANLFGTPVITNLGTGKNQFVFNAAGGLPVGLGFELDYGTQISAPGRFLCLYGNRISKGQFAFKPEGFPTLSLDFMGSNFDWTQASTIQATPDDFGHSGFSMFSAALKEGGSAIGTVQEWDLSVDNDMDNSLYTIGGGGVRGSLPEGMIKISGTVKALFTDMTLLNKALANTDTSLNLVFTNGTGDGTVGNDKLTLDVPHLTYKLAGPTIDGPKGLIQTLSFSGFRVGGAEQAATATLLTPRATA